MLIAFGVPAIFFAGIVILGLVTRGAAPSFALVLLVAGLLAGLLTIAIPRPERSAALLLIPSGILLVGVSMLMWFQGALTDEWTGYELVMGVGLALSVNYTGILIASFSPKSDQPEPADTEN